MSDTESNMDLLVGFGEYDSDISEDKRTRRRLNSHGSDVSNSTNKINDIYLKDESENGEKSNRSGKDIESDVEDEVFGKRFNIASQFGEKLKNVRDRTIGKHHTSSIPMLSVTDMKKKIITGETAVGLMKEKLKRSRGRMRTVTSRTKSPPKKNRNVRDSSIDSSKISLLQEDVLDLKHNKGLFSNHEENKLPNTILVGERNKEKFAMNRENTKELDFCTASKIAFDEPRRKDDDFFEHDHKSLLAGHQQPTMQRRGNGHNFQHMNSDVALAVLQEGRDKDAPAVEIKDNNFTSSSDKNNEIFAQRSGGNNSNEISPNTLSKNRKMVAKNYKRGLKAMTTEQFDTKYVKKSYQKSEAKKQFLCNAISKSVLFRKCDGIDLNNFVDAFDVIDCPADFVLIREGEEGQTLYVMETGSVEVTKNSKLIDTIDKVYIFGEVALLNNIPRTATVVTKKPCTFWQMTREDFRGVSHLNNERKLKQKISFLTKVPVGSMRLGDILEWHEIEKIAIAARSIKFRRGDFIVREGDEGNELFMIESGRIDVYREGFGEQPIRTMKKGEIFGEMALLSDDGLRVASCVVSSDISDCICLSRNEFKQLMGSVSLLMNGIPKNPKQNTIKNNEKNMITEKDVDIRFTEDISRTTECIKLSDLDVLRTIGVGSFGKVKAAKKKDESLMWPPSNNDSEDDGGAYKSKTQTSYFAVKCIDLKQYEDLNMLECLDRERDILSTLNHPFVANYFHSERVENEQCAYLIMELLMGGELFQLLHRKERFNENWSVFYAGVVVTVFQEMHSQNILYRDLKPENLVLDSSGFAKIIDFGLAKKLQGCGNESQKTWTLCGTPDYSPPEMLSNEGQDISFDYWTLGIFIYELCAGQTPFHSPYPMQVYENILSMNITMPSYFSPETRDIISEFLHRRQSMRLGMTHKGIAGVIEHPWFRNMNFEQLLRRKLQPPFVPELGDEIDFEYFDDFSQDSSDLANQNHLHKKMNCNLNESEVSEYENKKDHEKNDVDMNEYSMSLSEDMQSVNTKRLSLLKGENRHHRKLSNFILQSSMDGQSSVDRSTASKRDSYLSHESNQTEKRESITSNLTNPYMKRDSIEGASYVSMDSQNTNNKINSDSMLLMQLMNMVLADNLQKEEEKQKIPFQQFSLFSFDPKHFSYGKQHEKEGLFSFKGTRFLDPFYKNSADLIDQYPRNALKTKNNGTEPDLLSAFCFPQGLSVRLFPRVALDGARRLKWFGKQADRYQLHAFTDGRGNRNCAISILIYEEASCDDVTLHHFIAFLKRKRCERWAARQIAKFCFKCYHERKIKSIGPPEGSSKRKVTTKSNLFIFRNKKSDFFTTSVSENSANSNDEDKDRTETWPNFFKRQNNPKPISASNKNNSSGSLLNMFKQTFVNQTQNTSEDCQIDCTSVDEEYFIGSGMSVGNSTVISRKSGKHISSECLFRASEACKSMKEAEDLGDVVIIEKCYVMIGTKAEEQSLLLCALQKLIDAEREVQEHATRQRRISESNLKNLFTLRNNPTAAAASLISSNRHTILQSILTKLMDRQKTQYKSIDSGNGSHFLNIDLSIGKLPKISLPLPLPHVSKEWGLATLIKSIGVTDLLIVLKLLLIERSILLIGINYDEVTASTCALLDLLKPYKWASVFMPLLPEAMLDIVDSPVPFIVGITVQNTAHLHILRLDQRIQNAMAHGMSVINLRSKEFVMTSENSFDRLGFIKNCNNPITSDLLYYQTRLHRLCDDKTSALNSFAVFFQRGLIPEERFVLKSISDIIEAHFASFAGVSSIKPDGYKNFGKINPISNEFEFYPDMLLEPLREQLAFQEVMTMTQLFMSYIEEKKDRHDLLEGSEAQLIARWVSLRWRKIKLKRNSNKNSLMNRIFDKRKSGNEIEIRKSGAQGRRNSSISQSGRKSYSSQGGRRGSALQSLKLQILSDK